MEPTTGLEPVASSLPRKCSTAELCGPYILIYAHTTYSHEGVMERVMGIEPTLSAWKAEVLPLNYTRLFFCLTSKKSSLRYKGRMVGGGGRIRTYEGISRQIYSLIPLAAREPLPK